MRLGRVALAAALAAAAATGCSSGALSYGDGTAGAGGNLGGGGAGPGGTSGGTGASGASGGGAGASGAAGRTVREISWAVDRDVDLLFMVDNSSSMAPLQTKLVAAFPAFATALQALPGGVPNLHLAVVSSTLGAGPTPFTKAPGCDPGGDQGKFQFAPRGACTTSPLAAGETFIKSQNGANNFTGALADAFGCIAPLGQNGCGFEHQLASVVRALGADGRPAPAENAGFLRPGALLAVVLLTNEDDCSAPPDAKIFDETSQTETDPYGPLQSYRCNEFGHLCDGKKPPRTVSMDTPLENCHSAEDGVLLRVADIETQLRALKADPGRVLVAAITAPPTPYVVGTTPSFVMNDPGPWATIKHSCMGSDGTYGDPSVRLSELLAHFGANGVFGDICSAGFGPVFDGVVGAIAKDFTPTPCLEAAPVDTDLAKPGLQADCTFVDHATGAGGTQVSTPLPSCDKTNGAAPCWTLTMDARCGAGRLVAVSRAAGATTPASTTVSCALCAANDARPGCAP